MPFVLNELPPSARDALGEHRVALVIGNGEYEIPTLRLNYCVNDAKEIAQALAVLGFDVTLGENCDLEQMTRLLAAFQVRLDAEPKPNAALLFYSGHGLEIFGHNYLLPTRAAIWHPAHLRQAMPLDDFLQVMTAAADKTLVFIDACRNNPIPEHFVGEIRPTSGMAFIKSAQPRRNVFIALATDPGEIALEGDGPLSPFTAALVKFINVPGMKLHDIMLEVRKAVISATKDKQWPWQLGNIGEFYFLPPKNNRLDHQEWEVLRLSQDLPKIRRFLTEWPDSYFRSHALDRIRALEEQIRADNEAKRKAAEESYRAQGRIRIEWGRESAVSWIAPGGGRATSERIRDLPFGPEMVAVPSKPLPILVSRTLISIEQFSEFVTAADYKIASGGHLWTGSQWHYADHVWWMNSEEHAMAPVLKNEARKMFDWMKSPKGSAIYHPHPTDILPPLLKVPSAPPDFFLRFFVKAYQPVLFVSRHDAQAYAAWLSTTTKRKYRLLTGSEWDHIFQPANDERNASNALQVPWGDPTPGNVWGMVHRPDSCGVWEWVDSPFFDSLRGDGKQSPLGPLDPRLVSSSSHIGGLHRANVVSFRVAREL